MRRNEEVPPIYDECVFFNRHVLALGNDGNDGHDHATIEIEEIGIANPIPPSPRSITPPPSNEPVTAMEAIPSDGGSPSGQDQPRIAEVTLPVAAPQPSRGLRAPLPLPRTPIVLIPCSGLECIAYIMGVVMLLILILLDWPAMIRSIKDV